MNTNAILYGKGVFSTIAVVAGQPFQWNKHWHRLADDAEVIDLDISEYNKELILKALSESIDADQMVDGRARITLSDGSQSSIWAAGSKGETNLSIMIAKRRSVPESLKLTVSPYRTNSTSPLAGIKSCNYLESILAIDEAKSRGCDEAIRSNERGELTSGCMSNVFWLAKGTLFTPDLSTGCLAGTTRSYVLDNLECKEVRSGIEELIGADAVFLTSAGIGIKPVKQLDAKQFEKIEHPLMKLLPY